jgi:hypothetical protein
MDVFFAMGVPGSNPNDPSFFLRLPHLWAMFIIPIVCFYTFLAVWVVRKVREAMAAESHRSGAGPSAGPPNVSSAGSVGADGKASEPDPKTGTWPFDVHFHPCVEPAS